MGFLLLQVLQYLLDDVSLFFTTIHNVAESGNDGATQGKGCTDTLKAFLDYISGRERENFDSRKHDNEDSVTLTTIHQVLLPLFAHIFFTSVLHYDTIVCPAFDLTLWTFCFAVERFRVGHGFHCEGTSSDFIRSFTFFM